MIIGLNGRLKSGKDTTFGVIQEFVPGAEQVSFAAALKTSASASLNMSPELMESLKSDENIYFNVHNLNSLNSSDYHEAYHWKMNMRQFLQWYGTEGHRNVFGDDFWVDQALPLNTDHHGRLLVVTDMRFPNEFQRVADLGGIRVKVEREAVTSHGNHPSEQDLDHLIDFTLDNTGTLNQLRANVKEFLQRELALGATIQHELAV